MSYQLNHPKAYLGYAVALDVGGDPASAKHLTTEYITNGTSMARRGAQHLDLVDDEHVTEHVFTDVGDPEVIDIVPDALEDSHAPSPNGDVPIYQSPTVHQLKTVLWHLGLLVEKGTQAKDIDPTESFWGLEPEADD